MWILYRFVDEDKIQLVKASQCKAKLITFKKEILKPSTAYLKECKRYAAKNSKICDKFFSKENFTIELYNDIQLDAILNFLKRSPYWLSHYKDKTKVITDDATCKGLISKTGKWVPEFPKFEGKTPEPLFYGDEFLIEKVEVI
jgi:hypothetical protein